MRSAQQINDSFRKQIRNRQKQELFRSIRNSFTQQECGQQQPKNAESYLQRLVEQMKNSDGVRVCNKILDEGIHHTLVQNLKDNSQVEISLQVIASIMAKDKVKISSKFVRLGLLEEIVRLSENRAYVTTCMNIMANIVFENSEYAEMMLENQVHRHLFQLLRAIVLSKDNNKIDKSDEDAGYMIMWALAALLEAQSTLRYRDHFLQILNFALEVLKKDLYVGIIIEIIFLVGYSFREETQIAATWAISSILNQVSSQSKYRENLLIVIKLLSPIKIDYSKISTLAMTAEGKTIKYCLQILQKIVDVYPNCIPRNFEWWERYYLKLTRPEDVESFVIILTKSKIRHEFVYPLLRDILQKHSPSHLTTTNEVLICINSLLETSENPEEKKKAKFYLKSSAIIRELERLYECKNTEIHRKSQYLLTALNSTF